MSGDVFQYEDPKKKKLRLCVGNSSVDKIYIVRPKPGPVPTHNLNFGLYIYMLKVQTYFISAMPTCAFARSELLQCFVAVVGNIVLYILSPVYYAS